MPAPGERPAPLRVAQLTRRWGELTEGFLDDTVVALADAGCEVFVLTGRVVSTGGRSPGGNVQLVRVPRRNLGRFALERLLLGPAPAPAPVRPYAALARLKPDVLHAQFAWAAVDAHEPARRLGLPWTATFRGADVTVLPSHRSWRRCYPAMLAALPHAITVSHFLGERLRALGYRGPITVIPSPTALDAFPYRGPIDPGGDVTRLLFVGRQIPYKGVDVLLEALALLPERAHLDVIGDGPQRGANERRAKALGVAARVHFHGARPRTTVADMLAEAHLVVVPSRVAETGQAEGLPNVAKEAQAVGVPVVATREGGLPEAFPPDQRDALVPGGDAPALARAITARLDASNEWEDRARASRRWVEQQFAPERVADRTLAVYDEIRG